jgi:hypothetical protein
MKNLEGGRLRRVAIDDESDVSIEEDEISLGDLSGEDLEDSENDGASELEEDDADEQLLQNGLSTFHLYRLRCSCN